MHTLLKNILYRADSEDLFQDTSVLQRQNEARKRKSTALAARIMHKTGSRALSADFVLYGSLVDHVRTTGILHDGRVLELGWNPGTTLPTVQATLSKLPMQQSSSLMTFQSDFDEDIDISDPNIEPSRFFRVLHMTPARWKTVHVPAVLGGRVAEKGFLLTPCKALRSGEEKLYIMPDVGAEPVFLNWSDHSLHLLRHTARAWQPAECPQALLLLKDHFGRSNDSVEGLSQLLHFLISHRAIQGMGAHLHISVGPDDPRLPGLHDLENMGLSQGEHGQVFLSLTVKAVEDLQVGLTVCHPENICDIRPGIEIRDMSSMELQWRLRDLGWTWQPLPRQKAKRQRLSPYTLDGPLVWFSGATVSAEYLRALLSLPDLHAQHGIDTIPHGEAASVYTEILRGVTSQDLQFGQAKGQPMQFCSDNADDLIHGLAEHEEPEENCDDESIEKVMERLMEDLDESGSEVDPLADPSKEAIAVAIAEPSAESAEVTDINVSERLAEPVPHVGPVPPPTRPNS